MEKEISARAFADFGHHRADVVPLPPLLFPAVVAQLLGADVLKPVPAGVRSNFGKRLDSLPGFRLRLLFRFHTGRMCTFYRDWLHFGWCGCRPARRERLEAVEPLDRAFDGGAGFEFPLGGRLRGSVRCRDKQHQDTK